MDSPLVILFKDSFTFPERMVKLMVDQITIVPVFQWITVPGYFSIVFRVKACKDAKLFLGSIERNAGLMAFEVIIGQDNMKSAIKQSFGSNSSIEVDTPYILSCDEYRAFHVSWSAKSIVVGMGSNILSGHFMHYATNETIQYVQAIAFESSHGHTLDYEIVKLIGEYVSYLNCKTS